MSNNEKVENKAENRRRNVDRGDGVSSNGKEELFLKLCNQSRNFLRSRLNKQAVSALSDGTGNVPRKRNGVQRIEIEK